MNNLPLHRFWFGRFQVHGAPGDSVLLRDALVPPARRVARSRFAGLSGRALQIALFQAGFAHASMPAPDGPVRSRARDRADSLFWQYPCVTEGAAWQQHADLTEPVLLGDELHMYVGLPWATWIDFARKAAWPTAGAAAMAQQLQMMGVRISGLRGALDELGIRLRVHTVCQHIYWRDMASAWRRLGITDAWLSHCPPAARHAHGPHHATSAGPGFTVHPWALFAVNVRDPQRRAGLVPGRDPASKTVLASFTGAHAAHYLSNTRLRLGALANEPGFTVRITEGWHFEDVVYAEQIGGQRPVQGSADTGSVASYNALLSDSVFSLCPAGAGANTLRLWESLAVGAVPVLCGPQPMLPAGGSLPAIDWDRIVVRVPDDDIAALPSLLKAMPMTEVRARQQLGMQAYAQVIGQRCF